jgi:hypothetical protein
MKRLTTNATPEDQAVLRALAADLGLTSPQFPTVGSIGALLTRLAATARNPERRAALIQLLRED